MQTTIIFAIVGFSLLTWVLGYTTLPLRGRVPMQYTFSGNPTWSIPVWMAFPLLTVVTLSWVWVALRGGDDGTSISISFFIQSGALFAAHVFLYFSGLTHKNRVLRDLENQTSGPDNNSDGSHADN